MDFAMQSKHLMRLYHRTGKDSDAKFICFAVVLWCEQALFLAWLKQVGIESIQNML